MVIGSGSGIIAIMNYAIKGMMMKEALRQAQLRQGRIWGQEQGRTWGQEQGRIWGRGRIWERGLGGIP